MANTIDNFISLKPLAPTLWRRTLIVFATVVIATSTSAKASNNGDRNALGERYPQPILFRAEQLKRDLTYKEWADAVKGYSGLIAKLQNEIMLNGDNSLEWYQRYKSENPHVLVLVHYLYGQRNRDDAELDFKPAHWLHYAGASLALGIDKMTSEITINNSADPDLSSGSVLDICSMTAKGKPNWARCESITLVAVDRSSSKLKVKRGQWGTRPLDFSAGSYIASRVQTGSDTAEDDDLEQQDAIPSARSHGKAAKPKAPTSKKSSRGKAARTAVLWWYNLGIDAPTDENGANGAQIYARTLARKFASNGSLASFNGVAFDVCSRNLKSSIISRGVDVDGDGIADHADKANASYSAGGYHFAQLLREAVGPNRILIGEGWHEGHQRNFGIFNGMESEGWPRGHADLTMRDWSGGINRALFWTERAYPVNRLTYFVYKYRIRGRDQVVPASISRLFQAGAAFTGAAVSQGGALNRNAKLNTRSTLMDEVTGGAGGSIGWLGRPQQPPIRLAKSAPNILASPSNRAVQASSGSALTYEGQKLQVSGNNGHTNFSVGPFLASHNDLTLFMTIRAAPAIGRPAGEGRLLRVKLIDDSNKSVIQESYHPINQLEFEASYFTTGVSGKRIRFDFDIEDHGNIWLSNLSAHEFPDAIVRRFENGLVLANPSSTPVTFKLNDYAPNTAFRRLTGSDTQDPIHNSGEFAEGQIQLTKDALFLVTR